LGHSEALQALSTAQLNSGDYKAAVANQQQAVELVETAADAAPEEIANANSKLGGTLFVLRRGEEAIGYLERAISLRRSSLEPDARRLAIDLDYLGNSIFDGGDQEAGLKLLREGVDTLEQAKAPPSDVADNLTRLGLRLVASGRFDEARTALDRSFKLARDAAAGGHHPELQDVHLARATLAEAQGSFDEAASELELALAESQSIWGAEHPKTAMVRLQLGKVLLAGGRYEAAASQLRKGRATLATRSGSLSAHLGAFDLPLAQALAAAGRTREAVEIARPIAADPTSRYAGQAEQLLSKYDS
jgi:tetratricopeptide (TPR) repeat protein